MYKKLKICRTLTLIPNILKIIILAPIISICLIIAGIALLTTETADYNSILSFLTVLIGLVVLAMMLGFAILIIFVFISVLINISIWIFGNKNYKKENYNKALTFWLYSNIIDTLSNLYSIKIFLSMDNLEIEAIGIPFFVILIINNIIVYILCFKIHIEQKNEQIESF